MDDFSFEEDSEDEYYVRKKRKRRPLSTYKVCEGCEHILFKELDICPFCKAYRFTTDKQRILDAYEYFKAHYKEMIDWEIDQY